MKHLAPNCAIALICGPEQLNELNKDMWHACKYRNSVTADVFFDHDSSSWSMVQKESAQMVRAMRYVVYHMGDDDDSDDDDEYEVEKDMDMDMDMAMEMDSRESNVVVVVVS